MVAVKDAFIKSKRIIFSSKYKQVLEKIYDLNIKQKLETNDLNYEIYKNLLKTGLENASWYLNRKKMGEKLNIFEENNLFNSLVDLQKQLNLAKIPRKIECYDISHLSGKFVYGSMVCFVDGISKKSFYRLFKTKDQNDDFANHKEVLTRRLQKAIDILDKTKQKLLLENVNLIEKNELELKITEKELFKKMTTIELAWMLPDLIIVDGGKGQLSSDITILEDFYAKFKEKGYTFEVDICALAKKNEEIFLPNQENSVILKGDSHFLVQRIRDEAHRFAITANQKARLKTVKNSQILDLKGIGEKTKNKILTEFGSVQNFFENLANNPSLVNEKLTPKTINLIKNSSQYQDFVVELDRK